MNIQELATLAELDLPVAVLVFNMPVGLVRQQQELFTAAATKPPISPRFPTSPRWRAPLESAGCA